MDIKLNKTKKNLCGEIFISGSKSESNRLLLLKAIYNNINIENFSNSEDSLQMTNALNSKNKILNINHAGTAMRFLTSYYAFKNKSNVVLTGSKRMEERPISILVNSLREIGASIEYLKKTGYPPLKIIGTKPKINKVTLSSDLSSQYISSLMLIAPKLRGGLEINLTGELTSLPYIKMTKSILEKIGVKVDFFKNKIKVFSRENIDDITFKVESDWSSASYFFSIVALSNTANLKLSSFKKKSFQGDSCLVKIYNKLGVNSSFRGDKLIIEKHKKFDKPKFIKLNLIESPDIAQTIAVTCLGLGIRCDLEGLHTLKVKETDRLIALKNEITKLGAKISVTNKSLSIYPTKSINKNINIFTYDDHRMAMSFAPLAICKDINILNAEVVNKSYPNFWNDIKSIGIEYSKI
tara:strand:+ start:2547 stop:3773 length:1227 start_codon:yes stop_codon:yes gene_type:complete